MDLDKLNLIWRFDLRLASKVVKKWPKNNYLASLYQGLVKIPVTLCTSFRLFICNFIIHGIKWWNVWWSRSSYYISKHDTIVKCCTNVPWLPTSSFATKIMQRSFCYTRRRRRVVRIFQNTFAQDRAAVAVAVAAAAVVAAAAIIVARVQLFVRLPSSISHQSWRYQDAISFPLSLSHTH